MSLFVKNKDIVDWIFDDFKPQLLVKSNEVVDLEEWFDTNQLLNCFNFRQKLLEEKIVIINNNNELYSNNAIKFLEFVNYKYDLQDLYIIEEYSSNRIDKISKYLFKDVDENYSGLSELIEYTYDKSKLLYEKITKYDLGGNILYSKTWKYTTESLPQNVKIIKKEIL